MVESAGICMVVSFIMLVVSGIIFVESIVDLVESIFIFEESVAMPVVSFIALSVVMV